MMKALSVLMEIRQLALFHAAINFVLASYVILIVWSAAEIGGASAVGLVFAFGSVANLLFVYMFHSIGDLQPKKAVLAAICILSALFILFIFPDDFPMARVYILSSCFSPIYTLLNACSSSILKSIASDQSLVSASYVISVMRRCFVGLGSVSAGYVSYNFSPNTLALLLAFICAVTAILVLFSFPTDDLQSIQTKTLHVDRLRYLGKVKKLLSDSRINGGVIAIIAAQSANQLTNIILPIIILFRLHSDQRLFGITEGALAAGGLVSVLVLFLFKNKVVNLKVISVGALSIWLAMYLVLAISTDFILVVTYFFIGFLIGYTISTTQAYLVASLEKEELSSSLKVISSINSIFSLAIFTAPIIFYSISVFSLYFWWCSVFFIICIVSLILTAVSFKERLNGT